MARAAWRVQCTHRPVEHGPVVGLIAPHTELFRLKAQLLCEILQPDALVHNQTIVEHHRSLNIRT